MVHCQSSEKHGEQAPSEVIPKTSAQPPPTSSAASESEPSDYDHYLGDKFRLGQFTYAIESFETAETIGSGALKKQASPGASFVIVRYSETNEGSATVTGLADSLVLLDQKDRQFSVSSKGKTALVMAEGKDLLLTELHPGVVSKTATVFEVPAEVVQVPRLRVVVSERGLSTRSKTVLLMSKAGEWCQKAVSQVVVPASKSIQRQEVEPVLKLVSSKDKNSLTMEKLQKVAALVAQHCRAQSADDECAHVRLGCDAFAGTLADGIYKIAGPTGDKKYIYEFSVRVEGKNFSLADVAYRKAR